jgi:hypothetical protein
MFAFLTPYLMWIKIGAAVLVIGGAFGSGIWLEAKIKDDTILTMQKNAANALAAADAATAKRQAAADQITHDTDVANALAHQKIVTVSQKIIQKVPVYVDQKTDASFPIPCGFAVLHDAAASGSDPSTVPIPAGKSDADICPVTASTAASIIASNYALALGWRQDAIAWENWYAAQSAAWNK